MGHAYQTLKHIIAQRFTVLEKLVADIQKDFDKDAIHAFRVQVKKLRAFLRLMDLKLPGKIKKVYAAAGQIRDIQLQLKQISKASEESTAPVEYLSLLKEQLKKRTTFFGTVFKENHFRCSRKKLFKRLPATLPFNNIGDYLLGEIAAILVLAGAGLTADDDLHSTRKKIKDIIYINELYKEELKQHHHGSEILDDLSQKKTLALANELGKFVDKLVSLSLLKPGWLKNISPAEKKQLQSLQRRWMAQKRSLRKLVTSDLQSTGFHKALNGQAS